MSGQNTLLLAEPPETCRLYIDHCGLRSATGVAVYAQSNDHQYISLCDERTARRESCGSELQDN